MKIRGIGDPDLSDHSLKERHLFWSGARYAAEELAWPIAILAGFLADAKGLQWWASVPIGIAAFFLIARYFGRREEAAEDAYHREKGIGRYYKSREE